MDDSRNDPTQMIRRKATVAQIAKLAGVGTATVDRVLHGRAHVGAATRQRVLQAKEAIEAGTTPVERPRPWRLRVFLPEDAGPSTEFLGMCFQEFGGRGNATVECVFTKKMEPGILARKLLATAGQGVDAVAFQALDDPRVHDAVHELDRLNIPALAILSPIEHPALAGFIGLNNRAAGRTGGYLMGRLTRRSGAVVVVTSGQLYRSHEDREMGFRVALRQDFPHVQEVLTCNAHDDGEGNYQAISQILSDRDDIVGIYSVGGGNLGIARALGEAGREKEIVFICHNLTPRTQGFLMDGTIDIVLHVNMRLVAEEAVEAMCAYLERRPFKPRALLTGVITRENIVGATFG
ncbi:LacI family DNA-binding transcriptional regulator [Nioella sp. MMSF_3534]|jgi:LacI family transcriptional regulator|uniref:LacI family DNA-binding transcriptional regulator n=1 Tax=Nioella sp. MMSF_3534 TaxID=3046720 RepID=UPI00273E5000|nr:LacI family DNA-binding transcriptional regulator [Nioella sp. MMSF_3534]